MSQQPISTAPVVLLTDFGNSDVYVGVMKGVIARISTESRIIDLSHEIPPQDVLGAACALLFSYRYFPAASIFCCVVDPGVGTQRQPVALELATPAGVVYLVCPDNGLVTPLLERVRRAVVLDDSRFHLPTPSTTFHGRDIFAPAAAHLAAGTPFESLGSRKEPHELATIDWPRAKREGAGWRGAIIHVDRFGNLITNIEGESLASGDWVICLGELNISGVSSTFGDVALHEPVAYVGSSGCLELAIRQGNAATRWGASVGDEVAVEPPG